jgi:hypothetical protein
MTTHSEFRRAAWQHWGLHIGRWFGAFALGTFVFVALWFILEIVDAAEAPETRAEYAMAVALAVGLVMAVVSIQSIRRNTGEDPRLVCPHCQRPLGNLYVTIVLSSGNCPHCAERVLED